MLHSPRRFSTPIFNQFWPWSVIFGYIRSILVDFGRLFGHYLQFSDLLGWFCSIFLVIVFYFPAIWRLDVNFGQFLVIASNFPDYSAFECQFWVSLVLSYQFSH